jgi:O-acetyl-ADP-ribose deacetylase (regulator of RNase III)
MRAGYFWPPTLSAVAVEVRVAPPTRTNGPTTRFAGSEYAPGKDANERVEQSSTAGSCALSTTRSACGLPVHPVTAVATASRATGKGVTRIHQGYTGVRPEVPPRLSCRSVELEVVNGNIATLDVDAIANAANNHLWMGAGVAGAIKGAGGEEIEREAVAKGPIEIGDAVATGAGSLPARHVIHGAVMGQDLRTDADKIARTTTRVLEVADEVGARSLALPAFGTGVGGFPLGEAAAIMVGAVRAYEPAGLERVVFAVYGDEAEEAFRAALAE